MTVLWNSRKFVEVVQNPEQPHKQQPEPTRGTRITRDDAYVYVIHDDLYYGTPRTLRDDWIHSIAMTNELFVPRRWYFREEIGEWRVDKTSKITFWPEKLSSAWETHFWSRMTNRQHELFNGNHFGWRDGSEEINPFNLLLSGGTLLKMVGEYKDYTLFACQDTDTTPNISYNYYDNPDKVFLQGICGYGKTETGTTLYYGSVNKNIGRLEIHLACPGGVAAIQTNLTRKISVPFYTMLDGINVTFTELCVVGSDVLGKTENNEWFYIIEQATQNGNQSDFIVHVPNWPVLPISYVNYQKT